MIINNNNIRSWVYSIFTALIWGISFLINPLNLVVNTLVAFCLILLIAYILQFLFFHEKKFFTLIEIFIISVNSYIYLQLFLSHRYWGNLSITIDRVWKFEALLLSVHLFISFFVLLFRCRQEVKLLFGTIFYTSIFFLPISSTPEGSMPFQTPMFMAFVLMVEAIRSKKKFSFTRLNKCWVLSLALFFIFTIISVVFSYNPGDSLLWLVKLIIVVVLIFSLALFIENWQEWRQILIFTLLVNLSPLLIASIIKFLHISSQLGLASAITYRLNLSEFGRANLIVRELMISIPILISVLIITSRKLLRSFYVSLILISFLFFGLCRSWGGLIGSFFVVLFFFSICKKGFFHRLFSFRSKKFFKIALIVVVGAVILAGGSFLASRLNIGTFNGRLFQFRASILQIKDHLITGLGPSVYHLKAVYANKISWVADTSLTIDNPLLPIRWYQDSSTYHAHNLFLEIGVGSGIFALASFIAFLFFFMRFGIKLQKHENLFDKDKILVGGLLLGLIAAIGWGFLDVMQPMPPFFATIVWVFVSLIINVERFIFENEKSIFSVSSNDKSKILKIFLNLYLFIFVVILISFAVGNSYYKKAFQAYQVQDWRVSEQNLQKASLWEPLNAKYHQLRAETLINLGEYDKAEIAYLQALKLKRDFAPYERQLGWLAWLRGDLETAEMRFEHAVSVDPNNAWSSDLYNSLALVKAAQGDIDVAKELLARQFIVTPDLPVDLIWQFYVSEDGKKYNYPDPVLIENKVGTPVFQNRILVQLGKANFTKELLDQPIPDLDNLPILFDNVYPFLEKKYEDIPMQNVHEKRVMLATLVQTGQLMGLTDESVNYARKFINDYPDSVFGYQKMAKGEFEKGHFQEAIDWLNEALQVSHNEKSTLIQLAEVYIASGKWNDFYLIYSNLENRYPLVPDVYRLKYRVELINGNQNGQIEALKRQVALEASSSDYLNLYELLKVSDFSNQASNYCELALDEALHSNLSLFSREFSGIGQCMTDIYDDQFESKLNKIAYQNPKMVSAITFFGWSSLDEIDKRTEILQKLYRKYPTQWEIPFLESILMNESKKFELEELKLLEIINNDPYELLPRLAIGELYLNQNREVDAVWVYEEARLKIPGSREILLNLADLKISMGDSLSGTNYLKNVQRIYNQSDSGEIFNFWVNLPQAQLRKPSNEYISPDFFETFGNKSMVIFMHPESSAEYLLILPKIEENQTMLLSFSIGLLPQSWFMEGDGVQFEVNLVSEGESKNIFNSYIDPKNEMGDRYWQPVELNLTEYQGSPISIELKTSAGLYGDNRFDWAGWGDPKIVLENN